MLKRFVRAPLRCLHQDPRVMPVGRVAAMWPDVVFGCLADSCAWSFVVLAEGGCDG